MKTRAWLVAGGIGLVAPSTASAQAAGGGPEVAMPSVRLDSETPERPTLAQLEHLEGPGRAMLVWGPGVEPTTCMTPCLVRGEPGQYGLWVASGGAGYSLGFRLEPGTRRVRVRVRGASMARTVGGGFLIAFGAPATTAGTVMSGIAIGISGNSFSSGTALLFGVAIGLPLLLGGVPMLIGGIALVGSAPAAASIDALPEARVGLLPPVDPGGSRWALPLAGGRF